MASYGGRMEGRQRGPLRAYTGLYQMQEAGELLVPTINVNDPGCKSKFGL